MKDKKLREYVGYVRSKTVPPFYTIESRVDRTQGILYALLEYLGLNVEERLLPCGCCRKYNIRKKNFSKKTVVTHEPK